MRRIVLIVLFCFLGVGQCFAAISLSVNPTDGSNTLRFEKTPSAGLEGNQQIHIRINNSSTGTRYQVFQRILEPIANEKGETLNLQAMETQTLAGSSSAGTLYLQNASRMSMSDQLLYSSSQSGANDGFMIGYSLDRSLINAGGIFRGRLVFTVRGEGQDDQVVIDVFIELTSSMKISVKGSRQSHRIRVQGTDTTDKTADYVTVSFSGNGGQEIRVYQELEEMPQNETDKQLTDGVIQLESQGDSEALRLQGTNPLVMKKTLIYSSNKPEDSFALYFLADPDQMQQQEAGTYQGRLKYTVETDQGAQGFALHLECDVPPIFTMNVVTPPGGVAFTHVLANTAPQDKAVQVTVSSNTHMPYQVSEDLQTSMTNNQGKEFDNKYFTVQVLIPPGQKGKTDFSDFTSMQTGDYPVFSSDSMGSSATFTVVYRLQGYDQMSPGDFLAPIRFSLNQK